MSSSLIPTLFRFLVIAVCVAVFGFSIDANALSASDVSFDDSSTNLDGVDVQEAIEAIDTAVLGSVALMRDIQFDPPVLNGDSNGLFWPLTSPSSTQFFEGVISTDEGGTLAQPNNVYCIAYNFDECGPNRIDAGEHALKWMLEATRLESPAADEYVQNRVTFTADDGTSWDPWIFRVNVDQLLSSFEFNSSPTKRAFTLFETGEVRIGPEDPSLPTHQLEVMGSTRITASLEVQGNLLVSGNITQNTSSNQMLWGDGSNLAFDTATEVCAAAGLSCQGAHEPDGSVLACGASPASGFLFALCQ